MNPIDIAQYTYLILLALMAGVVFIVVLLFFLKLTSGEKKETPKQELKKCGGTRSGRPCRKKLYICDNCKEVGCEMVDCTNRVFNRTNCRRCESSNSREDHFELIDLS